MNKLGVAYVYHSTLEDNVSMIENIKELKSWVKNFNRVIIENILNVVNIDNRRIFVTQLNFKSKNYFLYVHLTDEELFLLKVSGLLNVDPEHYILEDNTKLWIPKDL